MPTLTFDPATDSIAIAKTTGEEGFAPASQIVDAAATAASNAAAETYYYFMRGAIGDVILPGLQGGGIDVTNWTVSSYSGDPMSPPTDLDPSGTTWTAPEAGLYEVLVGLPVDAADWVVDLELVQNSSVATVIDTANATAKSMRLHYIGHFNVGDVLKVRWTSVFVTSNSAKSSVVANNSWWSVKRL